MKQSRCRWTVTRQRGLAGLRVSIPKTKTGLSGRKVATCGKSPSMGSRHEEEHLCRAASPARRPVTPPPGLVLCPASSLSIHLPGDGAGHTEGHVLAVLLRFRARLRSPGPTCTWTRSAQAVCALPCLTLCQSPPKCLHPVVLPPLFVFVNLPWETAVQPGPFRMGF